MKFALMVLAAPCSSQAAETALRFAESLLAEGHELYRVFFYNDGVYCGSGLSQMPQDQFSIPAAWTALANKHQLDLVLCISSALRRGLIDEREAQRYELPATSIAEGFTLSGLGQWIDATINADRCVSFGP